MPPQPPSNCNQPKSQCMIMPSDDNLVQYWKETVYDQYHISSTVSTSENYNKSWDTFMDHYSGDWPPKVTISKSLWPNAWHIYLYLYQQLPDHDTSSIQQWINDTLDTHFKQNPFEFETVIMSIYRQIMDINNTNKHSSILFGLLQCISTLVAYYTSDSYKDKLSIYLMDPWYTLNKFYGLSMVSSNLIIPKDPNMQSVDKNPNSDPNDIKSRPRRRSSVLFDDPEPAQCTQRLSNAVNKSLRIVHRVSIIDESMEENIKLLNGKYEEEYIESLDEIQKEFDEIDTFCQQHDGKGAEQFPLDLMVNFLGMKSKENENKPMLSTQKGLIRSLRKSVEKRDDIIPMGLCSDKIRDRFDSMRDVVQNASAMHHGDLKEDKYVDVECPFGFDKLGQFINENVFIKKFCFLIESVFQRLYVDCSINQYGLCSTNALMICFVTICLIVFI